MISTGGNLLALIYAVEQFNQWDDHCWTAVSVFFGGDHVNAGCFVILAELYCSCQFILGERSVEQIVSMLLLLEIQLHQLDRETMFGLWSGYSWVILKVDDSTQDHRTHVCVQLIVFIEYLLFIDRSALFAPADNLPEQLSVLSMLACGIELVQSGHKVWIPSFVFETI